MIDPELVRLSQSPSCSTVSSADFIEQNGYTHGARGFPTSAPYTQTQFRNTFEYPSPSVFGFEFSNHENFASTSTAAEVFISLPSMPPPQESAKPLRKRHKYTSSMDSAMSDTYSPSTGPPSHYNPFVSMSLRSTSSVGIEEPTIQIAPQPHNHSPLELHRLSVQSPFHEPPVNSPQIDSVEADHERRYPIADSTSTTYGYDRGLPDLDTPNNDDFSAIAIFSPPSKNIVPDRKRNLHRPQSNGTILEKDRYYAKAVAITIPKCLEPLPTLLTENPMNLLYFHHFLNHTARVLIPHDCEKNPFRQILPESMYDEHVFLYSY